jgi:hypothetical protein
MPRARQSNQSHHHYGEDPHLGVSLAPCSHERRRDWLTGHSSGRKGAVLVVLVRHGRPRFSFWTLRRHCAQLTCFFLSSVSRSFRKCCTLYLFSVKHCDLFVQYWLRCSLLFCCRPRSAWRVRCSRIHLDGCALLFRFRETFDLCILNNTTLFIREIQSSSFFLFDRRVLVSFVALSCLF